jgi:hypothetical protein
LASDDLSDAGIATAQRQLHFRSGSKADLTAPKCDSCFTPESGL